MGWAAKLNLWTERIKQWLTRRFATPRARLALVGSVVGVVFVGGLLWMLGVQTAEQTQEQLAKETKSCGLPVVGFKANAFSIGVPDGWLYEVDNGTVSVMEDETNTTAAFLYTARLQEQLSAAQFLTAFAGVFEDTITGAGGSFSVGDISEDGDIATAPATAQVAEGALAGKFQVDKTNDFATLRVYWAPTDKLTEKEPILRDVVDCFVRQEVLNDDVLAAADDAQAAQQTAATLQTHTGQYFSLLLPSDFSVTGETDSGIDTSRNDNQAGFSFAYVTGAQGPLEPRSWAENTLAQVGMSGAELGAAQDLPAQIDGQVVQAFEFSGALAGNTVRGKITVGVYNTPDLGFGQSGSAFSGVQIAAADVWPGLAATLQTMQDSVQILDIGSRKNVALPQNRPIETTGGDSITSSYEYRNSVQDRAHDNWSEAMRGYETTESPSTGQQYDVPLNSWNTTGSDGPGYYRSLPGGGTEKLQELE